MCLPSDNSTELHREVMKQTRTNTCTNQLYGGKNCDWCILNTIKETFVG